MTPEKQVFGTEVERLRYRDGTKSHQNEGLSFHLSTDRGYFCRFLRYRDGTLIDIYHTLTKKKRPHHSSTPSALRASQRRACDHAGGDRLRAHRRDLVCRLAEDDVLDAGLITMLADAEAGIQAVNAVADEPGID